MTHELHARYKVSSIREGGNMLAKANKLPDQYINRTHAAEMMDCSTQYIDKVIKAKKLRAFHLGRKVLISVSDLLALLQELRP